MSERVFGTVPDNIGAAAERGVVKIGEGLTAGEALERVGITEDSELADRIASRAVEETNQRLKRMAPAGTLGLPQAVEAKRWQYGITDGYFTAQAAFDRILVFQIPDDEQADGRAGGGMIFMAETSRKAERDRSCRGVLLSAGLRAIDELRSNGIALGDTVHTIINTPHHRPVETILGKRQYCLVMRAGDIIDSEELQERLRSGKVRFGASDLADGGKQHVFLDEDGKLWVPEMPWISEDF